MPMIRRADQHDIKLLLLEHLAVIAVGARRFGGLLPLAGDLDGLRQHVLVRVAKSDDFNRRNLNQPPQIALPIPPRTYQTDTPWLLRSKSCRHETGRGEGEQ